MKTGAIVAMVLVAALFTAAGCAGRPTASADATVDIGADEFAQTNHASEDIQIAPGGILTVTLGSNPTTGFSWGDTAEIADARILKQTSYELVGPDDTNVVGAGGDEVWTFAAIDRGTTTVSFAYSRPWEGGEKGVWTLDLTVTVQ